MNKRLGIITLVFALGFFSCFGRAICAVNAAVINAAIVTAEIVFGEDDE